MNLRILLGLAVCVANLGLSAPASADITYVTYTGTVKSGDNYSNMFGGGNLTGQSFIASYIFDTAAGFTVNTSIENSAQGGSILGYLGYPYSTSPNISASLTINGSTFSFVGSALGYIYATNYSGFSQVLAQAAAAQTFGPHLYTYAFDFSSIYPVSITDPISIDLNAAYSRHGFFESGGTLLYLDPTHMTIGAPIPEPETYAMLLAGLGLLGFAARRRKLKEAATA